ncbi:MAG: YdcF family protein [Faecalispora jeddahensis]
MHSLVFLTAFYVGKWFPPRKRVDYIVVLGSGLIDGKVPPLLAGRVDAALRYAARQKRKTGREPCLIMSGGQGADEPRPEAEAMREYAMEKGYPAELVLAETQSKNTKENFYIPSVWRGAQRGQAVLLYLCDKRLPSAAGGAVRRTGRLFL